MMEESGEPVADAPQSVAAVYEAEEVATSYLDRRMRFSWQRLLHRRQVSAISAQVAALRPSNVLEVAPGPARLSVELRGIERGTMVENSEEMLALARSRLERAGMADRWKVLRGDAFQLAERVPASAFDFAYTFRFIRHFREPERLRLYEQLGACLAPGAVLMFDVVNAAVRERIEARRRGRDRASGEIAVYDACYDENGFREEMQRAGFEVIALSPVLAHFHLQSILSYKLDDVAAILVAPVIALLESIPPATPLEWIALCRKR